MNIVKRFFIIICLETIGKINENIDRFECIQIITFAQKQTKKVTVLEENTISVVS